VARRDGAAGQQDDQASDQGAAGGREREDQAGGRWRSWAA
jgi:hypothetical protein